MQAYDTVYSLFCHGSRNSVLQFFSVRRLLAGSQMGGVGCGNGCFGDGDGSSLVVSP